jgi:hypothetical protein
MQCSDFADEYLVEHPLLMSYLENPDVWERTFQSLATADIPKLAALFRSHDNRLLEMLATNLRCAEAFFSPIKNLTDRYCAAAAESLTRLAVRSFDQRPQEMSDLFYISDSLFTDLLKNLSYPVVWQILDSMLRSHPLALVAFVWFLFACLLGAALPEREQRKIRLVHWIRKPAPSVSMDKPVVRSVGFNLLNVFFSQTGPESDPLRRLFLAHLPQMKELCPGHISRPAFSLARTMVVGLSDRSDLDASLTPLVRSAFDILRKTDSVNDPEAAACLDFLPKCAVGLQHDDVLAVLEKIMRPRAALPSEFAVRSAVALVASALQSGSEKAGLEGSPFRSRVEAMIAECWKSNGEGQMENTCLDLLAVLKPGLMRRLGENWRGIAAKELPRESKITKGSISTSGPHHNQVRRKRARDWAE